MALGLGDRLAELSMMQLQTHQTVANHLRRREALHLLINPYEMGNFGVLIQGKGLTAAETSYPLRGLSPGV
jgi:SAM-dependent MidA family methyltransferase